VLKFECTFIAVTSPCQVINHYYTYLEGHIDADTVSHMMQCRHLLTDDCFEVITSAPNDMRMNCVLLQCVKVMNIPQFLEFCNILKNIGTMQHIGEILETCE